MLCLSRQLLQQIREHARESYPQEGCGAMLGWAHGKSKEVRQVEAIPNERLEQASRRFLISSKAVRELERRAEERGWAVLGFFHSHPDAESVPSLYDREHAWPWYSYLIVSVREGQSRDERCWNLRDDRSGFQREELVILGGD